MTLDWPAELRKQAEHLVRLSKDPAWLDHARLRARELMDDPLWADLGRVMREVQSASTSAPGAGSTRASTGVHGASA